VITNERLRAFGLSLRTIALWGSLIRAFTAAVLLAIGASQALTLGKIVHSTYVERDLGDFGGFYDSGRLAATGSVNPYAVDARSSPNLNPPHVFFLLVPISKVERTTAIIIWAIASVGGAILALHLIFGQVPIQRTATTLAWAAFAVVCASPTAALLNFAQISWLLWPAVTGAWLLARRHLWIRAAVLVGIVMSVKPFLGILLLAMTSQRQTRAALTAVGIALFCFGMGATVFGWEALQGWVSAIFTVTWAGNVVNASLFGVCQRLFNPAAGPHTFAPVLNSPLVATGLWIMATVTVAAISFRAIRSESGGRSIDRVFAIAISAALLISPLAWIYYHFFWSDHIWHYGAMNLDAHHPCRGDCSLSEECFLFLCLQDSCSFSNRVLGRLRPSVLRTAGERLRCG